MSEVVGQADAYIEPGQTTEHRTRILPYHRLPYPILPYHTISYTAILYIANHTIELCTLYTTTEHSTKTLVTLNSNTYYVRYSPETGADTMANF